MAFKEHLTNFTSKINMKALVYTVSFMFYVVLLTCIFKFWSHFLASYILVLTIISGILYALWAKCSQSDSEEYGILSLKELDGISKLLRYATAVLSFISLMTTAKGLQNLVFSDDEAWLAYLASFAVQAILVCFSLTYCHIFTAIRSVKTLSERGKSLMTGFLTIFLAIAFVVSSSFSFSYIANNAYAQSWASDSEIMIERYLTKNISDLAGENMRIGRILYTNLEFYNESLSEAIDGYISTQDQEFSTTIRTFTLPQYTLSPDNSEHGYGLTDVIINGWKRRYPIHTDDIDGLVIRFDKCVADLNLYCDQYNQIVNTFDINSAASHTDWASVESALDEAYNELNELSNHLSPLSNSCAGLRNSTIKEDISVQRESLVAAINDFQTFLDVRKNSIDDLRTKAHNAANGYLAGSSGNSLPNEIEEIQKKIYTLNTTRTNDATKDAEKIIKRLSDILVTYSNSDVLSQDTAKDIVKLESLVKEYQTYIDLANQIETYTVENLSLTYNITEDAVNDLKTTGSVVNVTYNNWISLRDQDFLEFLSLLKKLPAEPTQDISQGHNVEELEGNYPGGMDNSRYRTEDVIYEASILRRDLLGDITDFERAFNYFKYDFTTMVFFSAFIAVFFDLGAFLTGCFIYGMEHFKYKMSKR